MKRKVFENMSKLHDTSLDCPRVRFNWGYHDARFDVERGTPRAIVACGPITPQQISRLEQPYYAAGYQAALDRGTMTEPTSTAAWQDWVARLDSIAYMAVWVEMLACELGSRAHLFGKWEPLADADIAYCEEQALRSMLLH